MGVRVVFPDMGKDPSVQLIEKTITENGTYDAITDGANGYSKVNVNVEGGGGGESDFSTANMTVVNNYENAFTIYTPSAMDDDEMPASISGIDSSNIDNRIILPVILYKGNAIMRIDGFPLGAKPTITTSGNIQYNEIANIYTITGDCTITIS